MVNTFFISLFLAELVWPSFDKAPIVIFGTWGLIRLITVRQLRVTVSELLFMLFMVSMLITCITVGFSGDTPQYLLLFILQFGLISFIVTSQKKDPDFIKTAIRSFVNWNVFIGAVGIIDYVLYQVGVTSIIRDYYLASKVDSFYAGPNIFGILCAFSLMFHIRQYNLKTLVTRQLAKTVILYLAVLVSASAMALGLLLLFIVMQKLNALRVLVIATLVIVALVSFEVFYGFQNVPYQLILNKRLELWVDAFAMWSDSVFFGIGTGNFQLNNGVQFDTGESGQDYGLHSLYLWLIIETGIVGSVIFLALIIHLLVKSLRTTSSQFAIPIFTLLLVSQLTEFDLDHEELFVLLFWLVAVSLLRSNEIYHRVGFGKKSKIPL